jgi:exopolysaccharide biosynthesis WecB/TagA/CpsF family protein
MKKGNVLGVRIACAEYDEIVDAIAGAARAREPMCVSALAVHGVIEGVRDDRFRSILNGFDLICPDGQPVRWALRWLGYGRLAERVYGPNLMLRLCERAARDGLGVYLFGSTDEILAALRTNLLRRFPTLRIVGSKPSRFRAATPEEAVEDAKLINASGAQLVFCGLGCPRQEIWCRVQRDRITAPLIAVGAAFPFHAGLLPQAPAWMQRRGLEWLFRLRHEPTRLWRRYLIYNPYYLLCLFLQLTRLRTFHPASWRADQAPAAIPG